MAAIPPLVDASLRDFHDRLIQARRTSGADSAEVAALVQLARAILGARATVLETLVDRWREDTAGKGAGATTPPGLPVAAPAGGQSSERKSTIPWATVFSHGGTMSITALVTLIATNWKTVDKWLEPIYKNPTATGPLLATILGGGALGGLINGYLAGSSGLMYDSLPVAPVQTESPTSSKAGSIFLPGSVLNGLVGAIGAFVAVWVPLWSQTGTHPTLQVYVMCAVASLVVGLGGSRLLTSQRDRKLLWAALKTVSVLTGDSALTEQLERAGKTGTIPKAVEPILGAASGAKESSSSADPKAAEAALLKLLDLEALKDNRARLERAGRPTVIGRDGVGLELGTLKAVRGFGANVLDAIQHLQLMDVNSNPDALRINMGGLRGGNPAAPYIAEAIIAVAKQAAEKLAALPANWRLPA